MIKEIFNEDDVVKICNLPINPTQQDDKLAWVSTSTGVFSVRSAYHMEKERLRQCIGESTTTYLHCEIWREIWRLRIPGTHRMFIWRACNNLLPTKENLFSRHLILNPLYPICEREVETVTHILWNCPFSKDCWMECSRRLQTLICAAEDFLVLIEGLIHL